MILGILSDTHKDRDGAIPHIIQQFKERGVQVIIHCGDITPAHLSSELFGGLPVICALVDGQADDPIFEKNCPLGWKFTKSGKRIVELPDGTKIYVGHKRHMDFLKTSEEAFNGTLTDLREENDGLRWVFGGHLHFQTFKQGKLVSFINPGAVEDPLGWGYEYTIVDTDSEQVIFSRILPTPDDRKTFSVGVISDTLDVSHRDAKYWSLLADELKSRGVYHIIHCGNIAPPDISRPELEAFHIYYAIRSDQIPLHEEIQEKLLVAKNWTIISQDNPENGGIVDIGGYRFYVQLDLGMEFMEVNEVGMDRIAMRIRRKHPETEIVLCGFTRDALYVEGQHVLTVNPGNANADRGFAVFCLPRREITFGHVPFDKLPKLTA